MSGAVLSSISDAVVGVSVTGAVTEFNAAAERLFGYRTDEVVGRHVAMLLAGRDGTATDACGGDVGGTGHPPTAADTLADLARGGALAGRRRSGEVIDLQVTITELDDLGGTRYIAVVRTPTERPLGNGARDHAMLEAISKVQSEFIVGTDPRHAFDALLQHFLDLSGSEYGFIGEVLHTADGSRYLKTHAITNIAWDDQSSVFYDQNAPVGLEFFNLETLFGEVLLTERVVVANDPGSDPRSGGLPPGHPPLDAFLGVPFFKGRRLIGMVGMANRSGGYSDQVVEMLTPLTQACANLVGALDAEREREAAEAALKKANEQLNATVEAIRRQNEQMRSLSELEDLLQSCESSDEVASVVAHVANDMFSGWAGALYLLSPTDGLLAQAASWGELPAIDEMPSRSCIAMRRSREHVSSGPTAPLNCRHVDVDRDLGICVPLVGRSETFGLLHLVRRREPIDRDELAVTEELVRTISRRISVSLANLALSEVLRDQSVRDPLTLLFNRRYMVETLERELRRRDGELQSAVSVILLDIDHFKAINDEHGHAAGDLVLAAVARVLESTTRSTDTACRIGGEEFLIVLPGCEPHDAATRCEAILAEVSALELSHGGTPLPTVTASAGIANHPRHGATPTDLVSAADTALYTAKRNGRNRLAIA